MHGTDVAEPCVGLLTLGSRAGQSAVFLSIFGGVSSILILGGEFFFYFVTSNRFEQLAAHGAKAFFLGGWGVYTYIRVLINTYMIF